MPDRFSCCGPGTGTNYEKRVNGTRNCVGNSNRGNGPTFLGFPVFLGIFQWDEPRKRVPFTAEPEIPEILTKWKAPQVTRLFWEPTLKRNLFINQRNVEISVIC